VSSKGWSGKIVLGVRFSTLTKGQKVSEGTREWARGVGKQEASRGAGRVSESLKRVDEGGMVGRVSAFERWSGRAGRVSRLNSSRDRPRGEKCMQWISV
jgi:hypothetical protein